MRKVYFNASCGKLLLFLSLIFFAAGKSYAQDFAIGTGTSGNANTSYPCPLQDYFEGSKMQYLYRASELSSAGMGPSNITAIRFNVISLATTSNNPPLFAMEKLQIKIATSSVSTLSATAWENVTTTVYGPVDYMAVTGINTFTFAAPFLWNGTDNIIVEICNGDPSNTTGDAQWTGNPVIPWTTGLGFNGSHSYRVDNTGNLCNATATTNTGDQTTRPNIIFTSTPLGPCTSPPGIATVVASSNPACMGTTFFLGLTGGTFGTGQTYQWQSSTDNTNWTDVASATAPSLSTSQTDNRYYRCNVTCGSATTPSTSLLVTTTPCYCVSMPSSTANEEIYSITVNGVTNALGCGVTAPGPGSIAYRYSNFTPNGPLTTLIPGTTISFSIQADECDGATFFSNGCAIWIDFNRNGVLTDPGEQVFVENATMQGPRIITGLITIPLTAVQGLTGMRIILAENFSGTGLQPCMTYTYGETEDYVINIAPSTPCAGTPEAGNAVTSKATVCAGENFNLSLGGNTIAAALTYQWQSSTDNTNWTNISGATSGYYTTNQAISNYYRCMVTCTNGGAFDSSASVQVIVLSGPPVATIASTPSDTVCTGMPVTLATANCTGCVYSWSNGASTNSINITAAGYYTVTVTNSCGVDIGSKEIVYKPNPSLSINATNFVCTGSSTQIQASGADSYSWSPATGLNTATGAVVIASPTTSTTYTVTGTLGGCSKDLTITISVNAIPGTPTIAATGGATATTFCQGGSVTLTSTAAAGNQWYKDGAMIAGATNQSYNATTTGNYTVRVLSGNCSSNASTIITVTVNPAPPQPTVTQVGNTLQSSASGGNQWYLNGSSIAGATGSSYTPNISGQYSVQVTASGCNSTVSTSVNFVITATNDPVLERKIVIAPNPVRDNLSIRYSGNAAKFSITLLSINGAILSRGVFTTTHDIDMRRFSAGIYVVRIVNERTGEKVQRMIVKQ